MQVKVINKTGFTQFIDTDGDPTNHDTIHAVGPRATTILEFASERQFLKQSTEFKNKVIFRKL